MKQLQDFILDALIDCGCGVLQSLELWNVEYYPMIKALPVGKHVINIGRHEITFKKIN